METNVVVFCISDYTIRIYFIISFVNTELIKVPSERKQFKNNFVRRPKVNQTNYF